MNKLETKSVSSESSVSLHDDIDGTSNTGESAKASQPVRRKPEWKQSQEVHRSKTFVFLGILLALVAGGVTTGIIVKREEENEFDLQVCTHIVCYI